MKSGMPVMELAFDPEEIIPSQPILAFASSHVDFFLPLKPNMSFMRLKFPHDDGNHQLPSGILNPTA